MNHGPLARTRISRRAFLGSTAAGAAGGMLLEGCGLLSDQSSSTTADDPSPNQLVLAFQRDNAGFLPVLIKRFNDSRRGFTVKHQIQPADSGQFFDRMTTQFEAGSPQPDLIGGDVTWTAELAANGWIADLSDRLDQGERAGFLDIAIQSSSYDGKLYGIPWFINIGLMFYRRDLLEAAGIRAVPDTWEELFDAARRAQQRSGTRYGLVFQGGDYEGGVVNGLEFIWSQGGDVVDAAAPGKVVIGSAQAALGLQTERDAVVSGAAPDVVASFREQDSHTAFITGQTVFQRNWIYVWSMVASKAFRVRLGQVGISPLPAGAGSAPGASALGGSNFYLNANSTKHDQAVEFIRFLDSEDSQRYLARSGVFLPSLRRPYEDQAFLRVAPSVAFSRPAVLAARRRPVSPRYSQLSRQLASRFNQSLRGSSSPRETTALLQRELQQLVRR